MSCNTESNNVPYLLGRLFSILEEIQKAGNPNINATIKDRYFNSASSRPATIFPSIINLAQSYLKRLPDGKRIYLENKMMEVIDKLGEEFPDRLTITQQGSFQLGYYHQTQLRYKKKEEN